MVWFWISVAGCSGESDPMGLEAFAGRYVLQSVGGMPLPHGLSEWESSWSELVSESILLGANLRWSQGQLIRTSHDGEVGTHQGGGKGRFELNGASIALFTEYGCGLSTCTSLPANGTLNGDLLVIRWDSASTVDHVYLRN
jgi:hypothetical protein